MANYLSSQSQMYGQQANQQGNQTIGGYDQVIPGIENNIGQYTDQANQQQLAMSSGYSPQQQAAILGANASGTGLQNVNTMSQQDVNNLQANGAQQSAILGNPQLTAQDTQANLNTLGQGVTQGGQNITNAAQAGANGILGAAGSGSSSILGSVDPASIGLDPSYTNQINSAIGQEGNSLGAATNNPNLGLSSQYLQNYQFTPQDQQNIVSAAGEAVGSQYQAQADAVQRAAAAQGETSPLAVNDAQQALLRQGAASAGSAMTAAQNTALQTNLGVQQQLQETQLGSAQDISSRQMQTAESLGGTQVGAAENLQQQAIGAQEAGQGLGLSASSQAANLGVGAATSAAGLGTQAATTNAANLNSANQFGITANQSANEYANNSSTQQNLALLQNQQQTQLTGQNQAYNQNYAVNNALSTRNQGIATQQQNQGNQYGNYLATSGQNATNNYYNGLAGRQSAVTGTAQTGINSVNSAYNTQSPSLFSQIAGGVTGAASALGFGS